jgi:prolyl-tRNA editing enzyme YbaK/EbsC (Cys-tRNA(Pro) deacylase)
MTVLDAILARLDQAGVEYRHLEHEPTRSSEDSARVRGETTRVGGKALVFKADDGFKLLVISAALRARSSAVRKAFGSSRLRFATLEELDELTGLVPGSVPPFGRPILPLPLYVDRSVLQNDRIAFNAGSLTHSVIMPIEAWKLVVEIDKVVEVAKGTES